MRKEMISGASLFQLPAMKKASEPGYDVITLDYLPENVGHRYSNHFENGSTTDLRGVCETAEQDQSDAISNVSSDEIASLNLFLFSTKKQVLEAKIVANCAN